MPQYLKFALRLAVALSMMAGTAAAIAQQAYPTKPIRFVVPYPPGGATDGVARLLGQKLTEALNQQVVIDNRPGASGVIGADAVAKAPADGHSILLVINTHVINPSIMAKLPYAAGDFAPVATFASSEFLLAVNPSVPVNTLAEFSSLAKSKPGVLNYGTVGSAGIGRLAGEQLSEKAAIEIKHIPYKGSAPLLTDLLSGAVNFVVDTPNVYLQQIKAGKVKPIAVTGKKRLALLPAVPTFGEAGLPDYDLRMWFGVLAPAATPPDIVAKLAAEIAKIAAMPDVREKLAVQEFQPFYQSSAQFAELLKTEAATYARIVKSANVKE